MPHSTEPTHTSSPPAALIPDRLSPLRFISRLTITLVVLLASASFVLSFEALWHFAAATGAVGVNHAWVFPLIVDGSIVVFSVSALRCSILGESTRWSISLVVLVTALSMVFNIAHAPRGFLPALVGAAPPLLLFLSFESLMRQIKSELAPCPSYTPRSKRVRSTPASTVAGAASDRHVEAKRLLESGLSKRAVARRLSMGTGTVRRLAAQL